MILDSLLTHLPIGYLCTIWAVVFLALGLEYAFAFGHGGPFMLERRAKGVLRGRPAYIP